MTTKKLALIGAALLIPGGLVALAVYTLLDRAKIKKALKDAKL